MLQLLRLGGVAAVAAGAGAWLNERSVRPVPAAAEQARRDHRVATVAQWPQMTVTQNGKPRALVAKALENLGGMSRFVSKQDVVVLKPNIAWDRTPEQAANTNPEVVAEVVRQCWQAGAKRVIVTDVSCNEPRRCFPTLRHPGCGARRGRRSPSARSRPFPRGGCGRRGAKDLASVHAFSRSRQSHQPAHRQASWLTGATLGMKNWYGILGGERNRLHQQIHQSLVDLANFMLPTLTLMDCYRILVRNGPTGGNLEDVATEENAGGRHRSGGDRRVCRQGLLESRPRAVAVSGDGRGAGTGNRGLCCAVSEGEPVGLTAFQPATTPPAVHDSDFRKWRQTPVPRSYCCQVHTTVSLLCVPS